MVRKLDIDRHLIDTTAVNENSIHAAKPQSLVYVKCADSINKQSSINKNKKKSNQKGTETNAVLSLRINQITCTMFTVTNSCHAPMKTHLYM